MECDGSEYLCILFFALVENGYVTEVTAKWIMSAIGADEGFLGQVVSFVGNHADKLIAAAIGSFGAYKWYINRERILHERLEQYLVTDDRRFRDANAALLASIQRPGPKTKFDGPVFPPRELRRVLRERRWNFGTSGVFVADSANVDLRTARRIIADRIEIAEKALQAHKEQLAATHLVQAAVASAHSASLHDRSKGRRMDGFALTQIRSALAVPDFFGRLEALELEGHQLRRMGEYGQADEAYKRFELAAQKLRGGRESDLLVARSKRHQAEMAQIEKLRANRADNTVGRGAHRANALLRLSDTNLNVGKSALDLREPYGPFHGWDLLEQAELHYLSALVAHFISADAIADEQLGLASSAYEVVILELPTSKVIVRDYENRLRANAELGLDRVKKTVERQEYDTDWLLPP